MYSTFNDTPFYRVSNCIFSLTSLFFQSTGIQWYNGTNRITSTTGDGLNAGAMNTAMIIATQIADNQSDILLQKFVQIIH